MLKFTSACMLFKYKVGDEVKLGKYRSGGYPTHREGIITKLTVLINHGMPEPSYCIRHKGGLEDFFETTIMEKTC